MSGSPRDIAAYEKARYELVKRAMEDALQAEDPLDAATRLAIFLCDCAIHFGQERVTREVSS